MVPQVPRPTSPRGTRRGRGRGADRRVKRHPDRSSQTVEQLDREISITILFGSHGS